MPGWSTHCDANHISPIIDWEEVMNNSYIVENTKKTLRLDYK